MAKTYDLEPIHFTFLFSHKFISLHSIRKSSNILISLLHSATTHQLSLFAKDFNFLTALARVYDNVLTDIALSNGGIDIHSHPLPWLSTWLKSKVSLLDSFHIIVNFIPHHSLLALLDLPPSTTTTTPVPFLNRSLIADYQHAYSLADSIPNAHDTLVSALRALQATPSTDPGALILLLDPPPKQQKGKAKDALSDPVLDANIDQVLDILPNHPRSYIRALLNHPAYASPEAVLAALLEGTAPPPDDLEPRERRNVWDNDVMDLKNVHFGKKTQTDALVRDPASIAQTKADILRRAAQMADDGAEHHSAPFDDDADGPVPVIGDGEGSSASDDEADAADDAPEALLERAYIRDPAPFARDAATRRSRQRAELRAQTGWADEQIEGWRLMLERNPRKDEILQKHEFAGNSAVEVRVDPEPVGRGRGRGRGRGGGGSARERAWKDKNKASRGNHGRKRGHDKKVARASGL